MKKIFLLASSILVFTIQSLASVPKNGGLASALEAVRQSQVESISTEQREQLRPYYDDLLKIASMNNQGMKIRWKALILAAKVKPDLADKDVAAFAKHDEWFMRNAALTAVQEVNPVAAQRVAEDLVSDKALVVRSAAVDVMGKSVSPETRERLWLELNQKYNFKGAQSLWIRSQILEFLNQNPKSDEVKKFSKALFDKDNGVRAAAVIAMEKITKLKHGRTPSAMKTWQEFAKKEGFVE